MMAAFIPTQRTPHMADETETPKPEDNQVDAKKAIRFVGEIERLEKQIDSERGKFMKRCQEIRGSIDGVMDEAKDAGIPKKELKKVVQARKLEARADALREELEPDEIETYDQIRVALGDYEDTPLGQAALVRAENKGKSVDKLKNKKKK